MEDLYLFLRLYLETILVALLSLSLNCACTASKAQRALVVRFLLPRNYSHGVIL